MLNAHSQPYYFSHYTETYTPLTSGTSMNNGATWGGFQTFSVPIGFSFDYMGTSFTSVDFEASGRLIFDATHYYFADMFTASGLEDKGSGSSLSPLSYELSGSGGNQILKIEVNNATYQSDPGSTVNFQLWLYESSSRLELHMGPTTVNGANAFPSGAFSGVFHVTSWSPLTYGYGLAAYGTPAAPSDSSFSGTGINTFGIVLSDIPAENVVYRYTEDAVVPGVPDHEATSKIQLYPNPVTSDLYVEHKQGLSTITIIDCTGRTVYQQSLNGDRRHHVDVGFLTKGIYVLFVNDNISPSTFVKQ